MIEYKNTEYMITDRRILLTTGVLGVDHSHVYFHDVDSVKADVTLFEKLFGVGTLVISSDAGFYCFHQIPNVYNLTNEIQAIVNEKKSDAMYPNNKR